MDHQFVYPSNMSSLATVLVIGATGAQGIPVVKALVQGGRYAVRAFTRNPNSADARLIASLPNVSLFVGDLLNESDLRKAFHGAQLAYVNFNGHVTGEKGELYWGKFCGAGYHRVMDLTLMACIKVCEFLKSQCKAGFSTMSGVALTTR
jgi:NAD(P)-dependent dehydrogenase (short-subunit alcohol dehydrogenase family)